MKIDTQEMQAVAQPQGARFDMYTGIHKAMRAVMADTLAAASRVDVEDETELQATMHRVTTLAQLCRSHLDHENTFVHPAIEARCPGTCVEIAADHVDHEHQIEALIADAAALPTLAPAERPADALALYRRLALFVADNFQHMQVEETRHNAALWSAYSDQELMEIHGRILAALPPEETMLIMRWMVPALTPVERAGVMGEMRAHAPAPAFAAVMDLVQPYLEAPAWTKLTRSLGLQDPSPLPAAAANARPGA